MQPNQEIFLSLLDLGLKKPGAVQIYDINSTYPNGDIIPFTTQLSIVTHYLLLQDSEYAKSYQNIAEKLIRSWTENDTISRSLPDSVVNELSPLQLSLFTDVFSAPFIGPKNPKFTFIDLFAGIGGFRMALQENGGKCIFSSEWDAAAQRTYFANYGDVPFGDITKEETKSFIPEKFDILCGGFPCQPFSYAGLCAGFEDQTRGTLFFEICQILKKHRPKMFFLENVKGLVSHKNGETLKVILSNLRELGYDVHWEVLSSLDFGLPQKRERWYCVGFDKKVNFKFPEPFECHPTLRDIVNVNDTTPSLKLSAFEMDRIKYHFAQAKSKDDRVQHDNSKYEPNTKKGKYGVFSYQKPDGSLRFHVGDVAKTQIQEAFYACLDTYAPTIIAGRTPKMWDLGRKLSLLEALRLQGFPDNFIMPVSDIQAYKQLGNSVSVPVIRLIAEQMIKAYNI